MLAARWTRYACQRNGSWLRGDYASATRLAYWTAAAHVEGYQVRYRVKCLVLELVLGPLVYRFWLDHYLLRGKFVRKIHPFYYVDFLSFQKFQF